MCIRDSFHAVDGFFQRGYHCLLHSFFKLPFYPLLPDEPNFSLQRGRRTDYLAELISEDTAASLTKCLVDNR